MKVALALFGLLATTACGAKSGLLVGADRDVSGSPDAGVEAAPALSGQEPTAIPPSVQQARADKIDLLFVIDDSQSMQDKQAIFGKVLPDLVHRLTNPLCVSPETLEPVAKQPGSPLAACPEGALREFNSVQNLHVGVITSSLGGAGANNCGAGAATSPTNGRARLRAGGAETYDDLGFLAWDPGRKETPPGEDDPDALLANLARMVAVGENGCPYEMPLEAMYQFLVDPDPYQRVVIEECDPGSGAGDCARQDGLNEPLLEQRRQFLRPDSLVAVILLSDENDCSVVPAGKSYRLFDSGALARATSACITDPNDPCCQPCDAPERPECPSLDSDPECRRGPYAPDEDGVYLRCFDQKRRFGLDYLHPVERYVRGLTEAEVPGPRGELVDNPLFVDPRGISPPRDPSLVFYAAIVGVPWQDIAVDPFDGQELVFKDAGQMEQDGTWALVVGDPDAGEPPGDPLMIESIAERTGLQPVLGVPLAPSSSRNPLANPINGHEAVLSPAGFGLQYACIFDLPRPVGSVDCTLPDGDKRAICQAPNGEYGSVQYRGKAYPGIRELQVARGVGNNAIVGSICARNVVDDTRSDYGYRPALKAVLDRLRVGLQ